MANSTNTCVCKIKMALLRLIYYSFVKINFVNFWRQVIREICYPRKKNAIRYNPRCAHAHRGLMKALKCKPSALFTYSYSINILSKYSSLISHRPSMFEGRHIDYRSSKVDTSITYRLRRSTHPSPKVDTSISKSRHIDLRRSTHRDIDLRRATHRSSKVDASIFEDRRRKHHTYNSSSNIVYNCAPKQSSWSRRSYTRSYVHV